jgi:hypothetical protein
VFGSWELSKSQGKTSSNFWTPLNFYPLNSNYQEVASLVQDRPWHLPHTLAEHKIKLRTENAAPGCCLKLSLIKISFTEQIVV